ncbi:hypothetical protein RND61_14830 [Streptomyces sp. TRM76323]|uniref:Uncharacterized protein n=1 Tax=Streptomyces tamarix TaxID=3078565 RepID=A0ABU3QLL5_9ACTN|nr:hypothetical protein [Streptomyces tamarix]MDT9683338.1 hypothetical protein [Streptomyces tamarix]
MISPTNKIKTKFDKPLKYKKSDFVTDTQRGAVYYVTGRKKPVAYSTVAELGTRQLLGEDYTLREIANLYNTGGLLLSETEKQVIEVLISYGKETVDGD